MPGLEDEFPDMPLRPEVVQATCTGLQIMVDQAGPTQKRPGVETQAGRPGVTVGAGEEALVGPRKLLQRGVDHLARHPSGPGSMVQRSN